MQEWYVHDKGATTGPFTTEQVKESLTRGKIGAQATFCLSGTTTWRPLTDLSELTPARPTELPVMSGASCSECSCPIARNLKKVVLFALLAAVTYVLWAKFGHHPSLVRPM